MFKRSERLRELFFQELSTLMAELKDPGISGFVTLTGLDLSPDMKNARIFYSILGSKLDRESTAKALERSANFLRSKLMDKLEVRYVPKLSFRFDDTPEKAHRIEALLGRIEAENAGLPPLPDAGAALDSVAAGKRRRRRGR
ncbi:MAG TPA: 30S ribosome-binding factor RbfA [Elusimicrobiota bacterium]|jgi:ribosome-binding factor A|nr:30S ribosome-binding factor RbfA [Elusimicrobiota bacterium]